MNKKESLYKIKYHVKFEIKINDGKEIVSKLIWMICVIRKKVPNKT